MNNALIEIKAVDRGYDWVSKPIKGSEMTEQFEHGTVYVIKIGNVESPVITIADGVVTMLEEELDFGEDYTITVHRAFE